jgi:hypothetical protein
VCGTERRLASDRTPSVLLAWRCPIQPKQIKEIKDFLLTARRKDASSVKIKKAPGMTKFKVSLHFYSCLLSVVLNAEVVGSLLAVDIWRVEAACPGLEGAAICSAFSATCASCLSPRPSLDVRANTFYYHTRCSGVFLLLPCMVQGARRE